MARIDKDLSSPHGSRGPDMVLLQDWATCSANLLFLSHIKTIHYSGDPEMGSEDGRNLAAARGSDRPRDEKQEKEMLQPHKMSRSSFLPSFLPSSRASHAFVVLFVILS